MECQCGFIKELTFELKKGMNMSSPVGQKLAKDKPQEGNSMCSGTECKKQHSLTNFSVMAKIKDNH